MLERESHDIRGTGGSVNIFISRSFTRLAAAGVAIAMITGLLSVKESARAAEALPSVPATAGPVDRPLPSAPSSRTVLPPDQRPPAEPTRTAASGEARSLSEREWAAVPKPNEAPRATVAAAPVMFTDVALRGGFVLGDTSLVAYFNAEQPPEAITSWRVELFEENNPTAQAGTELTPADLRASRCVGFRTYCRSLGAADGWRLDPGRSYFVVLTARMTAGGEVPSPASDLASPRATITPAAVPAGQAAGCACGNALGIKAGTQAIRGQGVNTATGAYTRFEADVSMPSFGVPLSATRVYNSAEPSVGVLGRGWAWSYDMRVTAGDKGVLVRGDDGATALFPADGDGFRRPAGVTSTLTRAADGWRLETLDHTTFGFNAGGELMFIRDPRGQGVSLTRRVNGATTYVDITDASGRVTVATITDGTLRRIELPDKRHLTYSYANGLLERVRTRRGHTWRYVYDQGLLTEVIAPDDERIVTNTYVNGRITTQRVGATNSPIVTTFAWDAGARKAVTTDADGVAVEDLYRDNVLLRAQWTNGETEVRRYDVGLNRSLVVTAEQRQHEVVYTPEGRVDSKVSPRMSANGGRSYKTRTEYDKRGNPTVFTDEEGKKWITVYNEFDELIESREPSATKSTRYSYDSLGLRQTMTDARDKTTRFEYHPEGPNRGLLRAVITPMGNRTEFAYDATGRLIRQTDPRGTRSRADAARHTTEYAYDEDDRQTMARPPESGRNGWTTVYDTQGRVIKSRTPMSVTTHQEYTNGLLSKVELRELDVRRATKTEYTPAGRRKASIVDNPDGPELITEYEYDPVKGLLWKTISPGAKAEGANRADFTTEYVYDKAGNIIRVLRPYPGGPPRATDYKVDELDRTTGNVDEAGVSTATVRDGRGRIRSATDEMGRTTDLGYDDAGRQSSIRQHGATATKRIEYDAAGNKIKSVTPLGGTTTWTYDDDGRLASTTEPRGNAPGTDPAGFTTHYGYDAAGNLTSVTDPLGNKTTREFDGNNRVTTVTDARGNSTQLRYRHDDALLLTHAPDAGPLNPRLPLLGSTLIDYWSDGAVKSVTDPRAGTSRTEYDFAGRPRRAVDPLGRVTEVGYDLESQPISQLTHDGFLSPSESYRRRNTIRTEYDIAGRRTSRTLGEKGPTYRWFHDLKDRVEHYEDPTGRRTVHYDKADQIEWIERVEPGRPAERFTYGYDKRGNVNSRTYPDGTTVSTVFDEDSRAERITVQNGSAGPNPAIWDLGYDSAGRRTTTRQPGGNIETREYDQAGRLTDIRLGRPGQDPVTRHQLTLDPVGNPTLIDTTRNGVTESVAHAYDQVNRVTSACYAARDCARDTKAVGRIDYTYDLLGNRTSQVRGGSAGSDVTYYQYDLANQLKLETYKHNASWFPTFKTFDHDVRGNQTRAGRDRFEYHLDDTLAESRVNGTKTTFAYDASGIRLSAKSGSGAEFRTQRWSWDFHDTMPMLAIDRVYGATDNLVEQRGFLHGPDAEPLALLDPATGTHPYAHDWRGGVSDMFAPDGARKASYDYDPYGNARTGPTITGTQGGPENPLRYTGAYQDPAGGKDAYYLRAREYDTRTGRFNSVDPKPRVGESPYVYARGNPITKTDPTGEQPPAEGVIPSGQPGPPAAPGAGDVPPGPSPEEIAKAQQVNSMSVMDVILKAGVEILFDVLPINDILNCLKGDIGACVMTVVGSLPWGAILKAPQIAKALWKAGKAVVGFFKELKWAREVLQLAEKAAEAAKEAAAVAARVAAEKAAKAREIAEQAAKRAREKLAKKPRTKDPAPKERSAPACPTNNSFIAGTRVLMADGTSKPIEEIKPGDRVAASGTERTHIETAHKPSPRVVTRTINHAGKREFVEITIAGHPTGAESRRKVIATDEHPFWAPDLSRWVNATDLSPGTRLRTTNGTSVPITAVRRYTSPTRAYNLTIDHLHTYHVLAGDVPVLVHNANVGACPVSGAPHGKMGEAATRQRLQDEGYRNITPEVRFLTAGGVEFRADFVARTPGGNWVAVEAKTGRGAKITPGQEVGYPALSSTGAMVDTRKLTQFGMPKGSMVTMDLEIDLWSCPICGS